MNLNWDSIDTVLLDMDGTLLDLHFDTHFWLVHLPQRYAENRGITLAQAKQQLLTWLEEKRGTLDWYCLDHWSELTEMDLVALKHEIGHLIDVRPLAVKFLQNLAARGKRRVLITNAHRSTLALKFSLTGINSELDLVISSHDYGYPKEHQQFWQKLYQQLPCSPHRALFIDDSEPVLRAARQFGVGQLLGISRPDSRGKRAAHDAAPLLECFSQLMESS